jgi:peptidoglycan/xylan/chitin deacetylase (PgdA/CDA1 family)
MTPLPNWTADMTVSVLASVALLLLLPGAAAGQGDRTVAITIDDLPYIGGPQELSAAQRAAEGILAALDEIGAPARGFVTGSRVMVEGQLDERIALLRRWRSAGVRLENHSWSHSSFETTPFTAYADDVARGGVFPDLVMRAESDSVTFYRHPFNHTGPDETAKRQFEAWLAARGLRLTPFTVEHADYVFNALYVDAGARGDAELAARVEQAYLDQLDAAFAFAEELSRETFGREIPQIFLIHANALNGALLGPMLARLSERGYRFVTLEDALSDSAYLTEDVYVGPYGISWLHRWRHGLRLPNRLIDEPDPPEWIMDEYRALSRR